MTDSESTRRTEVSVGARYLAAFVTGPEGPAPTLVCESGLGGDHHAWDPVLAKLGPDVRVITYDRAGYGESPFASDGRHLWSLAGDLVAVCDALAPTGPLVLAGHSLGGRIVRAATGQPVADRVAGIVLVEGATDDFITTTPRVAAAQAWTLRAMGWAAASGLMRTQAARRRLAAALRSDPRSPSIDAVVDNVNRPGFFGMVQREWASMADPMTPAPQLPAVAILGDDWEDWGRLTRMRFGTDAKQLLASVRDDFCRLYREGRVVTVSDTTHNIQRDHPEVVVEAVRSFL